MQYDFVFLFEHTGMAAKPFTDLGYKTLIVDILNEGQNPCATTALNWDILTHEDELVELCLGAKFVFGFPPCTDTAVSGAKHFEKKLLADPDYLKKAAGLFLATERIAKKAGIPFGIENPVSVMASYWRQPDTYFNPYDFGGYLPLDDRHPKYPRYIAPRDAYPKKTCLWIGNGFIVPPKKPVTPEPGWARQVTKLGGKSARTKLIRAASPRGFFTALAEWYHV